jgi:hypothetical protein
MHDQLRRRAPGPGPAVRRDAATGRQGETEDLVSTYGIEHGTPVHPDARSRLEELGTTYPDD